MRTLFRFTLVLLLTVLVNNAFSQNRFNPNFKYKIKGEKSEYNAKDVYDGTKKRGIDISNIKNTYGTDRYPEHVEDHGGGKCSKEEFIQIFKIFRDAIGHKNYKKLLFAIAKDLRVIWIRLADRLDLMANIHELPIETQKDLARETMRIYVPIAMHLGIYNLKVQLEDLAFEYLYPVEYQSLTIDLQEYKYVNKEYLDSISQQLTKILNKYNVVADINGRLKHKYSIYQKLIKKGSSTLDSIFDIFGFRIILDELQHTDDAVGKCYQVLGVIHRELTPVVNRFKDYIANPKSNGYMSLHTTVLGLGVEDFKKPVEVQIRTKKMHEEAEYGIAAHSFYKDQDIEGDCVDPKTHWLQSIISLQKELNENINFSKDFEYDIFQDKIFVLSEEGKIYDLPEGACALDFAYCLSEDIGHRCYQVKVNGIQVSFDHVLNNGDVVYVQVQNIEQPNRYSLSFVKTAKARKSIKEWFQHLSEEHLVDLGRNMLNKNLARFNISLDQNLSLLKNYGNLELGFNERQQILSLLGKGQLTAAHVMDKILLIDRKAQIDFKKPKYKKDSEKNIILVTGEDNVSVEFAACCNPQEFDPIVGYVGRGNSVKIHHKFCNSLINSDHDRFVEVSWANKPRHKCLFFVKSLAPRIGFIADVSSAISQKGINILKLDCQGKGYLQLVLDLADLEAAEEINLVLSNIAGIEYVEYKELFAHEDLVKI